MLGNGGSGGHNVAAEGCSFGVTSLLWRVFSVAKPTARIRGRFARREQRHSASCSSLSLPADGNRTIPQSGPKSLRIRDVGPALPWLSKRRCRGHRIALAAAARFVMFEPFQPACILRILAKILTNNQAVSAKASGSSECVATCRADAKSARAIPITRFDSHHANAVSLHSMPGSRTRSDFECCQHHAE